MRLASICLVSLFAVPVLLTVPQHASACDPAPDHSVELTEDDSPDCAVIQDGFSYGEASLRVDNQCEEAFTLEPDACEGCGAPITVEAGEQATMVIESRAQASSPSVMWSMAEMSGHVQTDIEWRDNSDACDGFGGGCRIDGPAQGGPWLLGLGLLLLGGIARRRSVA